MPKKTKEEEYDDLEDIEENESLEELDEGSEPTPKKKRKVLKASISDEERMKILKQEIDEIEQKKKSEDFVSNAPVRLEKLEKRIDEIAEYLGSMKRYIDKQITDFREQISLFLNAK